MRNTFMRLSLSLVLTAAVGCSANSEGGGGTGGNSAGTGGTTAGTGGTSAGTGGTSAGTGGTSEGTGGTSAGTGGSSVDGGGTGGVKMTDGGMPQGDGGVHTPVPSAGCGKPNPNLKMRSIMTAGGMTGTYYINTPANYDINKPIPLGFGFHGHSNKACLVGVQGGGECVGFDKLPALTVYMNSLTPGWEDPGAPLNNNLQFYHDVLNVMKTEYCIDQARIFIAGVSSGAQFIEHIACLDGDTLWQVTSVSGYVDGAAVTTNCKGTPPALITQGATESNYDPNPKTGQVNITTGIMFAKRNGCSPNPPASYMQNLADMKTAFNMGKTDVRCMDWDGCTLNPVRYCISSQQTYAVGVTHGWPKAGGQWIADFQATLPK